MRKIVAITLVFLASMSGGVYALGLGEIKMLSALNQPLRAEINLLSARSGEADGLIATLASQKAFTRAEIARPFVLTQLRFKVLQRQDGEAYIEITSRNPIVEPFLNFLVEIDWPRGRLVREYTVLLDPPIFMTQQAESSKPAQAAVVETLEPVPTAPAVQTTEMVEPEPVSVVQTAELEMEPLPFAATEAEMVDDAVTEAVADADLMVGESRVAAEYGPVKKGETLWAIARRAKTGSTTIEQMIIAISRANPDAFLRDNVNLLREGAILRIPQGDTGITQADAVADFSRQTALWNEYRESVQRRRAAQSVADTDRVESTTEPEFESEFVPEPDEIDAAPELTLVSEEDAAEQAADAVISDRADATEAALESVQAQLSLASEELESEVLRNEELQSRLTDLEDIVSNMQRLITLRETELAELQRRLATSESEQSIPPVAAETDDDPFLQAEPEIDTQDVVEDLTVESEIEEFLPEPEPVDEPETVVDVEPVFEVDQEFESDTFEAQVQQSILDQFLGSRTYQLAFAATGGVLLLLAIIFYVLKRRKSAAGDADSDDAMMVDYGEFSDLGDDQFGSDDDSWEADGDADVAADDIDFGDTEVLSGQDIGIETESDEQNLGEVDATSTLIITPEDAQAFLGTTDGDPAAPEPSMPVKDDTIAEADVYLAYGLFGQAEDLLKLAIEEKPDKSEYQVKLAETYFAEKNLDAFVECAERLHDSLSGSDPAAWDRVASMGYELSPEHALFSGAKPMGKITPELDFGTDDLTGGDQFDSGLDLEATQLFEAAQYEETRALDTVESQAGVEPPDESQMKTVFMKPGDNDDDSMQESEDGEDADATSDATMDFNVEPFDETTDETLEADDDFTVDNTMDFDIDQLDVTADETSKSDADFSADETVDFNVMEFDETVDGTADASGAVEESSLLDFESGIDIDLDLEDVDLAGGETAAKDSATTDEDSSSADAEKEDPFAGLDDSMLDDAILSVENDEVVTAASTDDLEDTMALDQTFDSTFSSPDNEPGDESELGGAGEVDTMLDLAKAYIDMGDADSATSALNEIISAGNDAQKTEAKNLLKQLS